MQGPDNAIANEIRAGLDGRSKRTARWKQNRDMVYGETQNTEAYEGAYTGNFNLVPQKIDALGASVVDVICSVKPYCVARCYSDSRPEDKIEKVVQFFADLSHLKTALKGSAKPAAWANMAWIKIIWLEDELKFDFRALEPDQTVVYPAHVERLEDAKLFGDRQYMRRSMIEAEMSSGRYKKVDLTPSDVESSGQNVKAEEVRSAAVSSADEEIEVWQIYRTEDGKSWKKMTVTAQGHILKSDDVGDIRRDGHCYAELFFKPRSSKDGYYGASSVVGDLSQLQIDINSTFANLIDGTRMNTFGAFFSTGGQGTARQVGNVVPGGIYEIETDSLQPFNPNADLKYLPGLIEMLLGHADAVARISAAAAGTQAVGVDTATEAAMMGAGQQQSIDEYIENFGTGVRAAFKYMQSVLVKTVERWFPLYGEKLGFDEEDKKAFSELTTWEINVSSSGATPQAQMQMLMMLNNLSADPATGFDKYEIAKRVAETAERMGVTNAQGLQQSRDPVELIEKLAESFALAGTPIAPEMLLQAVAGAVLGTQESLTAGVAGMEGEPMLQDQPGLPAGDVMEEIPGVGGGQAGFGGQAPGGNTDFGISN